MDPPWDVAERRLVVVLLAIPAIAGTGLAGAVTRMLSDPRARAVARGLATLPEMGLEIADGAALGAALSFLGGRRLFSARSVATTPAEVA